MKKFVAMIFALAVTVFLVSCSSGGGSENSGEDAAAGGDESQAEPQVTLRIGDNWGASHPMAAALDNVFKKQIEEQSGGSITVDVKHDGLLGNEADLWTGVRSGDIQAAIVGTPMNQEFSMMLISDWPFLYTGLEHARKVWTESEVAGFVNGKFHEKFPEVEILGWGPNSARTFTSNKKLESFADFKGQLFRMPGNPIHEGIVENLGASHTVIALGELYTALETGTVDGQDNGMVTVIAQNFDKVQKYLYETNHIIATLEIVINEDFLNSLSDGQRTIVRDAAAAAAGQAWEDYIKSVDADRQTLIDAGMTVTPCSAEDQAKIIEAIRPLVDKLYSENDWAAELTDMVRNVQ
ncbi:MAG: TRAP transporter substrate-binding protein [Clostridiales Family XIII bacterium]|jgi:TRAP-type C4-dicarboxylate transport system substrate-binding protein|nr:TRAP transporter substrate-binding protein [Clostridiales Family XIII bacterium]